MVEWYAFKEAYQSLLTHKVRTLSMGCGVAWAIFILVLLSAIGNGFHRGIRQAFASYGETTVWISGTRKHAIPAKLVGSFAKQFNAIQNFSAMWWRSNQTVTYATEEMATTFATGVDITGIEQSYAALANIELQEGRFFTPRDVTKAEGICLLGGRLKEELFGERAAVGRYILCGNKGLQVVGVLADADHLTVLSRDVLLTNSLFQNFFPKDSLYVNSIRLTLLPTADDTMVTKQFRAYFAHHLHFDPTDQKAIYIWCLARHAAMFHRLFKYVSVFNWIIGICFLITGIIGMSNMMLVTIRERIQEFAIRRIMGGSTVAIIAMILWEVMVMALLAGIIGFISSLTLIQLLNSYVVPLFKMHACFPFATLTCPLGVAIGGWGLICLTAILAGMIPAMRAIQIKPVAALGSKS